MTKIAEEDDKLEQEVILDKKEKNKEHTEAAEKSQNNQENSTDNSEDVVSENQTDNDSIEDIIGEEPLEFTSDDSEAFDPELAFKSKIQDIFESKLKEIEDQNLRMRAEFSNYRKRVEKEQADFEVYAKSEILKKLLPVLDDFKLMVDKSNDKEEDSTVLEGAKLIYGKFLQILEKEGLEKIEAIGEKFDPQIHEALMMKPIDDEADHDKIVEVFQDGFLLKDRLLRPSKVVVGVFEDS